LCALIATILALNVSGNHKIHLVGLCNVGEDCVNHSNEHAVLVGVTGIFDNWDNVGALLCLKELLEEEK
jgi:hypothetical protein